MAKDMMTKSPGKPPAEKLSIKQAHELKLAAKRIRSEFRLAHRAGRDAIRHAIKAGETLNAAKSKLAHGA